MLFQMGSHALTHGSLWDVVSDLGEFTLGLEDRNH